MKPIILFFRFVWEVQRKNRSFKEESGKKTYPIETAIPNEETHVAFMEVKEKGHLMKEYTNVRELFKDIDNEWLWF